ncbi:MAG: hypothetical protein U9R48_05510 [Chloroflexota bacterium]|nr:hypothetical protein [Chloroflexota bacterium]
MHRRKRAALVELAGSDTSRYRLAHDYTRTYNMFSTSETVT